MKVSLLDIAFAPISARFTAMLDQLPKAIQQCHQPMIELPSLQYLRELGRIVEIIRIPTRRKLVYTRERAEGDDLVTIVSLIHRETYVSNTHPTFAAILSIHSATSPHAALISSHSTTGRPPSRRPLIVPTLIELEPA